MLRVPGLLAGGKAPAAVGTGWSLGFFLFLAEFGAGCQVTVLGWGAKPQLVFWPKLSALQPPRQDSGLAAPRPGGSGGPSPCQTPAPLLRGGHGAGW